MVKHCFRSGLLAFTATSNILAIAETIPSLAIGNALPDGHERLYIETIAVDRFGSVCPAPTPQASPPASTKSVHTTVSASASATQAWGSQTPIPFTTYSHCNDPVCPFLNNDACIDASGQTYGISCNATLTGLIMFPPGQLRPRTYAATFAECLSICDRAGGCGGVSWSQSNCLLYGSVTGVQSQNGSIAARRIRLA